MDFKQATNTQLLTIIFYEDCPNHLKHQAQEEYTRRQRERYARPYKANYVKIANR